MQLSKVFHVASVVAGVLGVVSVLSMWSGWGIGGGMMNGGIASGMMGYGQGMMPMGGALLLLIAIWLQIAAIHHMMLEKRSELI